MCGTPRRADAGQYSRNVREFFHSGPLHFQPEDLEHTNALVFLTRWITHICGPVFMFTAWLGHSSGFGVDGPGAPGCSMMAPRVSDLFAGAGAGGFESACDWIA